MVTQDRVRTLEFDSDLRNALEHVDIPLLYKSCKDLLGSIAYPARKYKTFEEYYQRLLEIAFKTICPNSDAEGHVSTGRYDLKLQTGQMIIIIELKKFQGCKECDVPKIKEKECVQKLWGKALLQAEEYGRSKSANFVCAWVVNTTTGTLFDLKRYDIENKMLYKQL